MAPRKAAANGEAGEGPFKWEGANDNKVPHSHHTTNAPQLTQPKLLLLTQGRYVKPDEYEQLTQAFPGTTVGSIRNRISALRVKQRDMYDSLNWTLPEGGAGHSAKRTPGKKAITPRKRGGDGSGGDGDDAVETPSKKPRAGKGKKDAPNKGENGSTSDHGDASGGSATSGGADEEGRCIGVKEEVVEEM
ncbi:hypothetical protein DDE82_007555 [Stemphylium lycopersici]|nr:hypothetical protein DDE82_007555 [Stemphylium lycopersici]